MSISAHRLPRRPPASRGPGHPNCSMNVSPSTVTTRGLTSTRLDMNEYPVEPSTHSFMSVQTDTMQLNRAVFPDTRDNPGRRPRPQGPHQAPARLHEPKTPTAQLHPVSSADHPIEGENARRAECPGSALRGSGVKTILVLRGWYASLLGWRTADSRRCERAAGLEPAHRREGRRQQGLLVSRMGRMTVP